MVQCAAVNCTVKSGQGVSMYLFPNDPHLRNAWLTQMKRDGFVPSQYTKICERHFEKDQFSIHPDIAASVKFKPKAKMLKPGAIPTLFDNQSVKRGATEEPASVTLREKEQERGNSTEKRRRIEVYYLGLMSAFSALIIFILFNIQSCLSLLISGPASGLKFIIIFFQQYTRQSSHWLGMVQEQVNFCPRSRQMYMKRKHIQLNMISYHSPIMMMMQWFSSAKIRLRKIFCTGQHQSFLNSLRKNVPGEGYFQVIWKIHQTMTDANPIWETLWWFHGLRHDTCTCQISPRLHISVLMY